MEKAPKIERDKDQNDFDEQPLIHYSSEELQARDAAIDELVRLGYLDDATAQTFKAPPTEFGRRLDETANVIAQGDDAMTWWLLESDEDSARLIQRLRDAGFEPPDQGR